MTRNSNPALCNGVRHTKKRPITLAGGITMPESTILAPWTDTQVASLNRFQKLGYVHEFTCPSDHGKSGKRVLIATNAGWRCPSCNYRQNWAHKFMLSKP